MVDVDDLVGVPFKNGGRNMAEGFDCWGLVMEVFKRHGQTLPDFTVDAFACKAIDALAGEEVAERHWEEVTGSIEDETPLVVLMRIHPEYITHVGVYLGDNLVLHTMEHTGAVLMQRDMLRNRIVGYYRPC